MLDEGPRDAAGVLRFPRGALGSLAHDEPHRKRLRDRQAQNGADERLAIINNCQADGVQAAQRRIKDLAAVERNKSVAKGHWRCQIPRWHRGHRSAGKLRRLIASSPKIPHSSLQLPSDVPAMTIEVPEEPLHLTAPTSDPTQLVLVIERIATRMAEADLPAILVDADVARFGLTNPITRLIEAHSI